MNGIANVAIDAFVLYADMQTTLVTLKQLKDEPIIGNIYVMMQGTDSCPYEDCEVIQVDDYRSSSTVKKIAEKLKAPYALLCMAQTSITFGYQAIARMCSVASGVDSSLVYADRYVVKNGETLKNPTMDFYYGSVRDDFDFGPVRLVSATTLQKYVEEFPDADYQYSGWYDLQLFSLRRKCQTALFHLREFLYTEEEKDLRTSGEKQFDYVNPRNREVQKEREVVCTKHLKLIGAYVEPESIVEVSVERYDFEREASVIIPVRNRVKTIEDAIRSALSQSTTFQFNVIVVDNLSIDGTTEAIEKLAAEDPRVVHIIPTRKDLGIGGCWSLKNNLLQWRLCCC